MLLMSSAGCLRPVCRARAQIPQQIFAAAASLKIERQLWNEGRRVEGWGRRRRAAQAVRTSLQEKLMQTSCHHTDLLLNIWQEKEPWVTLVSAHPDGSVVSLFSFSSSLANTTSLTCFSFGKQKYEKAQKVFICLNQTSFLNFLCFCS